MQQRLPDIERTLLSAYLDGELSATERQEAERLLESSDGARAYLRDLRAVNSVAIGAFPTIPAGVATGGAIAGGKLTAGAIKSAAAKGQGIGSLTSGWGLTGLAAAAALVVAGYSFLGDTAEKPVAEKIAPASNVAPATSSPAPLPVLGVDSSSFIIPAMTPAELIDFAVEGTLPVDSERERFITVMPNGENTISVSMHRAEPRMISFMEDLPVTGLRSLDPVHQKVRTALIPCSNNAIAVRSDIPLLRLQILEQLAESMPAMPANVRQEMERARAELRSAQREVERTRSMLLSGHGNAAGVAQGQTVLYIPVESEEVRRFASGDWNWERMAAPATFTIVLNESDAMIADLAALEAAAASTYTMVAPAREPALTRAETRVGAGGGDPTGTPATAKRPKNPPVPPVFEGNVPPPRIPTNPLPDMGNRRSQEELDDLLRNAEKSLQEARESLRRADEANRERSGSARSNSNDSDGGDIGSGDGGPEQ